MDTHVTRRRLFQACSVGAGMSIAGCSVGNVQSGESKPTDTESATNTESSTEHATRTYVPRYTFYIENFEDVSHSVDLTFREKNTQGKGEVLRDRRYRVPPRTGATFENIADVGKKYFISASVDGEVTKTHTWDARTCATENDAPRGNRDTSLQIHEDIIVYADNGCDAIAVGRELAYGTAEQFTETATARAETT